MTKSRAPTPSRAWGVRFREYAPARATLPVAKALASITRHPTAITACPSAMESCFNAAIRLASADRRRTRSSSRPHYVIGSGNHARTFLHRNADGRLVQMPVSWYAEREGYWAMSPGYDRPAHLDFRRVVDAGCMSCHNGYPRAPRRRRSARRPEVRRSRGSLPEGIDCQRCHGPGQAHVDAVKAGDVEAGLRAIVNPAKLDRDRQLESCMQCHLESTSTPLPFQIPRYEHPPFSYTPGKPLSDYFIHFDHAPGAPGARRQVRDRRRRVPPAQVGVLSAQRDDLPHVSQPARHRARCQSRGALRRDLRELPQDAASARRAACGGRRRAAPPASTATCRSGERKTRFTSS